MNRNGQLSSRTVPEGVTLSEFAPDLSQLLTVQEVAKLLKVPVSWVYEHTRTRSGDRIPGIRLGKYWRFQERDISAWIARRRDEGGSHG
jgi:excisionase family DNA binding protein